MKDWYTQHRIIEYTIQWILVWLSTCKFNETQHRKPNMTQHEENWYKSAQNFNSTRHRKIELNPMRHKIVPGIPEDAGWCSEPV